MTVKRMDEVSERDTHKLIFTDDWSWTLRSEIERLQPAGVWLVTDSNVAPLISGAAVCESIPEERRIVLPAGEENKNLRQAERVWKCMTLTGASRGSLVVCAGGGMVTDLGGFAAACFKRGVRTVTVPTTLLGAVDASVGGKTGIDFIGFKNEIGAFHIPQSTIISPQFLSTLPHDQILSGLGEMLKMAFILSENDTSGFINDAEALISDPELLYSYVRRMVEKKREITLLDPCERGLRKVLNAGHTAGHAFETLSIKRRRPLPHGCAVALGLVAELALSCLYTGLESRWLNMTAVCVRDLFPGFGFSCKDYDDLYEIMLHDKKNTGDGRVSFVLFHAPGDYVLDARLHRAEIEAGFDVMRDIMGI